MFYVDFFINELIASYCPGCFLAGVIFCSLSAWWLAFGLGKEFFGFDFVATAVHRGDEVIFAKEIDEHGEIFVIHDDD